MASSGGVGILGAPTGPAEWRMDACKLSGIPANGRVQFLPMEMPCHYGPHMQGTACTSASNYQELS
jgi:hypothetical protein